MAQIVTIESAQCALDAPVCTEIPGKTIDIDQIMPIEPVETLGGNPGSPAARALAVAGEYADRYAELRSASGLIVVEGLFAGYLEDVHTHTSGRVEPMDAVHMGAIAMGYDWAAADVLLLRPDEEPASAREEFVVAGLQEFRSVLESCGVMVQELVPAGSSTPTPVLA
ncbi:hypothetical protein KC957_01055 [Candidatus Saccharibacteria bacterium]|nr:hypothetical protein [Candidatus Saccharibacteria bacterium]